MLHLFIVYTEGTVLRKRILPVVVGYDIGAYSFARIFHEETGEKALVLTDAQRGFINNSRILDVRLHPRGTFDDDAAFIAALRGVEREFPDRQLILLVNSDEHVEFVARSTTDLAKSWFLPYSSSESVMLANSKSSMADVLDSLGLNTPANVVIDLHNAAHVDELDALRYPVVVKPESGADLASNWNAGLRKVSMWTSPTQAREACQELIDAGVAVKIIVQEFIPGDDTTQWLINGYVNGQGAVTACGSGHLVLGLHQPEYIGNAAIVLTEHHRDLIESAQKIVTKANMRGFFSFDVKIDPRDGSVYWLDLNPRIGRGHYYLNAAGVNLARAMIADMYDQDIAFQTNQREALFCIVPSCLASAHYVQDANFWARVRVARRKYGVVNPLVYASDRSIKRTVFRLLNGFNQYRRMRRYYPGACADSL